MIKELKWFGDSATDASWYTEEQPEDYVEYAQYILEHVSFVKLLKLFKLKPDQCNTGKFTHKMICPFKFHKNGRERTPSFRFNEHKKTFMCFGCLENGDMLKFLQLYCGGDEHYHLKQIASIFGLVKDGKIVLPENYVPIQNEAPKPTNHKIHIDIGIMLRNYLHKIKDTKIYADECNWADDALMKVDKYFDGIDEEDIEKAQEMYDKLKSSIDKRQKKYKII